MQLTFDGVRLRLAAPDQFVHARQRSTTEHQLKQQTESILASQGSAPDRPRAAARAREVLARQGVDLSILDQGAA